MEAVKYKEINKTNNALLSAVSHELRTPIAAIKGYSTMLLDYFPELTVEETKEYIQSIDNATDKLTKLLDNISDTSRLEAGLIKLEKTTVNITDLIKEAVKEAEANDKQHKIITEFENTKTIVFIDPQRIRQVLDNLLDNAAKRSPERTEIAVSANNNSQELKISVIDHGPERPAGKLSSIFELNNKTKKRTTRGMDGTGLRLYICQRLLAAHGGRIWAESTEGKGTTIQFSLPLTPEKVKRN